MGGGGEKSPAGGRADPTLPSRGGTQPFALATDAANWAIEAQKEKQRRFEADEKEMMEMDIRRELTERERQLQRELDAVKSDAHFSGNNNDRQMIGTGWSKTATRQKEHGTNSSTGWYNKGDHSTTGGKATHSYGYHGGSSGGPPQPPPPSSGGPPPPSPPAGGPPPLPAGGPPPPPAGGQGGPLSPPPPPEEGHLFHPGSTPGGHPAGASSAGYESQYEYFQDTQQHPAAIQAAKGRVKLFMSGRKPGDLYFHAGPTVIEWLASVEVFFRTTGIKDDVQRITWLP